VTSGAPCVLIVDDDEDIRETIASVLDDEGYRVVGLRNGFEALSWLRANAEPSLILLDLMMPGLSGSDLMKRRKLDPAMSSVPVVIMSGNGDLRQLASTLGASDCLEKPMDLAALLATVARHVHPSAHPSSPPFR
jgi:two-component system, OmpR family, response regulator CpxR